MKITTVISDFGGVLTTPLVDSFMSVQDRTGIESAALGRAMATIAEADGKHPLFELECGRVTEKAFLERLAEGLEPELGHRPELHRFSEIYFEALHPNPTMIDLMTELRDSGLRMAMLTNNVREWEPRWRSMLPVDEIFELVVDSAFVDCRKPEPRIYEITLERLGVEAGECIFIDDIEVNCEAASALGLTAIHFRETDQATAEIRDALD